eukprot:TRINITY_DN3328_c0_g1_i4.p2 TRINITY_DN3328_c0_g1~~TRINITY_DN3328_c0_g1_i4.p2  ORF type:complete len:182 (+),score=23.69 TRINITY_DN3328_c0_g1_i4:645-1190(+)
MAERVALLGQELQGGAGVAGWTPGRRPAPMSWFPAVLHASAGNGISISNTVAVAAAFLSQRLWLGQACHASSFHPRLTTAQRDMLEWAFEHGRQEAAKLQVCTSAIVQEMVWMGTHWQDGVARWPNYPFWLRAAEKAQGAPVLRSSEVLEEWRALQYLFINQLSRRTNQISCCRCREGPEH